MAVEAPLVNHQRNPHSLFAGCFLNSERGCLNRCCLYSRSRSRRLPITLPHTWRSRRGSLDGLRIIGPLFGATI